MLGNEKICAVVAAPDAKSMWRQLELALRQTRLAELRLDWLSSDEEIEDFLEKLGTRTPRRAVLIATCRRREAGGRYPGSVGKQFVHLAEAIRAGCKWYDLEIEASRKSPPELIDVLLGDGNRLASAHFFHRIPRNLEMVATELRRNGADAIKIAAQCNSFGECRKLIDFGRRQPNSVVIPMGEIGMPVRILSLKGKGTFAYAPVENATAPGQTSLQAAASVYRADKIDAQTRVYGVIGNPIGHSLSPVMQNAALAARRINAVYAPFLVRDLRDFLQSIGPFEVRGFSVTLPHKERILRHLDECDPLAERIGAVNTVTVRGSGKLYGSNTDYVGVLSALQRRVKLAGSSVLILGAGGAARAVAFALNQAGAAVFVTARRHERAKLLARDAGGEAIERGKVRSAHFDAIVNATPVGMYPAIHDSPAESQELNCRLVFDTIYRPSRTELLRLAARRGIETVSGVEMFVAQGASQFEIWTGQKAPVAVMRHAVMSALSREEGLFTNRGSGRKTRVAR